MQKETEQRTDGNNVKSLSSRVRNKGRPIKEQNQYSYLCEVFLSLISVMGTKKADENIKIPML